MTIRKGDRYLPTPPFRKVIDWMPTSGTWGTEVLECGHTKSAIKRALRRQCWDCWYPEQSFLTDSELQRLEDN